MILMVAAALAAQVQIQVDTDAVAEGQSVGLLVTVTDASARGVPEVTVPEGLAVAFESQAQNQLMINFHLTTSTIYRYQLTALKRGTYTIGPVKVATSAGTLTSAPVTLTVGPRASGGGLNQLAGAFADATAWVGEVVVYRMKFVTDKGLVNGKWVPPEIDGLEPEPGVEPQQKQYSLAEGGVVQTVQELWFPYRAARPGALTVPGGVFQAQFAVQRQRQGRRGQGGLDALLDGMVFNEVRTEVYSADPVPLTVRPLPEAGRPAGFSGVVGTLAVVATPSAGAAWVGDTVTVEVKVTGDVPLAGLTLPPVQDDGFRVYDDQPTLTAALTGTGIEATATFRRAVVPQVPGRLELPPVEIAYFDPGAGDYRVARAEPVVIEVGGTADAATVTSFSDAQPRAVGVIGEDILPVHTDARVGRPWPAAWAWLLVAPGAVALGLEAGGRLRARRPRAERRLGFADLPADPDARLAMVERIVRERIGERLGVSPEAVHRELLDGLGEHAEAAREVWRGLEQARYGGGGADVEPRARALVERLG